MGSLILTDKNGGMGASYPKRTCLVTATDAARAILRTVLSGRIEPVQRAL